jgi:hypothetical protein
VHSFEVDDTTPERFVELVNRSLRDSGLGNHVAARVEVGDIVARISWLGTTELRYRTRPTEQGFRAELQRQRVAALHGAFQSRFEERLEEILARVGARLL